MVEFFFGSRLFAFDGDGDSFFPSFLFSAHLDRVQALLLDVRLLGVGDDDQGAAARGDSAVWRKVEGRREEKKMSAFRFFSSNLFVASPASDNNACKARPFRLHCSSAGAETHTGA